MHTNTKINKWGQIEQSPVYIIGLILALLMFTQSVSAETIVFGPGNHHLTAPLVIDTDNTYIELKSGAVLWGVDPIITIKGPVTNIGVYGTGTLEGGVTAQGGVTNLSLEDITITNAEYAVLVWGQFGGCRDLRITGLTVQNVGEGILFRNCQNFNISNNTVTDMWAQDGIEPINSQKGIISNNTITNPGPANSAIDLFVNKNTVPGELAEISSVTISNNILTRTTPGFLGSGINLHGNTTGIILRNNQIVGTFSRGIKLIENPRNISITDHIFRDVDVGISVNQSENLIITESRFINNVTWSIVTGNQIDASVIVVSNRFSGNAVHIAGSMSASIDANIFFGNGWAINNGTNPVLNVTNNEFRGPRSISKINASNLFKSGNTGE